MAPLLAAKQATRMNSLGQDPDRVIEEQVRTDRLHQLFRQSFPAILGSYLGAVMLCWLCWDRFDHSTILIWLVMLAGSSLLRLQLFVEWFRCPDSERTPARWERRYWLTLMLSAGIWGGGALAVMPVDDRVSQVLVMLFAVGMSVSAVSCYSAYRYMSLVSMYLVLLPCTVVVVPAVTDAGGRGAGGVGVLVLCGGRHAQTLRRFGKSLSPDAANGARSRHFNPCRADR